MFSCQFCIISKNTFSYRALPVTASELQILELLDLPKTQKIKVEKKFICYTLRASNFYQKLRSIEKMYIHGFFEGLYSLENEAPPTAFSNQKVFHQFQFWLIHLGRSFKYLQGHQIVEHARKILTLNIWISIL